MHEQAVQLYIEVCVFYGKRKLVYATTSFSMYWVLGEAGDEKALVQVGHSRG